MSTRRGAPRRYLIRFGISIAAYCVLLPLGLWLATALADSPWRFAVVLLPLPAVAGIVWAMWRFVTESDEMQARIQLEALAVAVAGSVLTGFTYGQLETVGAPHIPWIWIVPLIGAWWGIGGAIAAVRRR